jgi:hypothetical protein
MVEADEAEHARLLDDPKSVPGASVSHMSLSAG